MSNSKKLMAYVAPMAVFIGLLAVNGLLKKIGNSFWLTSSEYWIYPLQAVLCGALLYWFWGVYDLRRPVSLHLGLGVGILVFCLWISPQILFGFAPRTVGFDPTIFISQPVSFWLTVILRFLRLVIVVPLLEEIFWRGFLLRYLIDEKFDQVPLGKFSWFSFAVVTVAFAAAHSSADWPAALLTGALYNAVAYRTKSLSTCVITHASTNLLLGLWIMHTKQWGFW
ncbi:MAG: protease family protein [Verrucomicrobiota bacterium]|jgi:CAAX prenyl protease-like protein